MSSCNVQKKNTKRASERENRKKIDRMMTKIMQMLICTPKAACREVGKR